MYVKGYKGLPFLPSVDDTFDPQEVLIAMRDYIVAYFGCRECAQHFKNEAASIENEVQRYDLHYDFIQSIFSCT